MACRPEDCSSQGPHALEGAPATPVEISGHSQTFAFSNRKLMRLKLKPVFFFEIFCSDKIKFVSMDHDYFLKLPCISLTAKISRGFNMVFPNLKSVTCSWDHEDILSTSRFTLVKHHGWGNRQSVRLCRFSKALMIQPSSWISTILDYVDVGYGWMIFMVFYGCFMLSMVSGLVILASPLDATQLSPNVTTVPPGAGQLNCDKHADWSAQNRCWRGCNYPLNGVSFAVS